MKEIITTLLESKLPFLNKEKIISLIEIPQDKNLGDFAFPCFVLAKTLKKSPQLIALEISEKIKPTKEIEKIQAQGPYINFSINKKYLAESTLRKINKQKSKYGSQKIKEKVIIESPGPNTNKPLHVGHIRNIVLAQSIHNILSFFGNIVKNVDIINDRGVHICKSMIAYEKFGKGDSPEKANKKSDHFVGDYYVKFSRELENNPILEEEAKECLKKWEMGDKITLNTWKKMNKWAVAGLKQTYKKFNIHIDKEYIESKTYKEGKKIVLYALKKGYAKKKEDGAIFVDLGGELGEKILLRANGTSVYVTQDIYLAVLRKKDFNFNKAIYVVAHEQDYHFKVLFKILKELGYKWFDKLFHLSYGMVNLESGKMKSREGNVVDADDLIEDMKSLAIKQIEKRYKNLSNKEKEKRAYAIALAAIRYYFLKIERIKDMIFKPEESISFEGNTGPYLLYTYARAKSILSKARFSSIKEFKIKEISPIEKSLIAHLSIFPDVTIQAYNQFAPNLIANYAYELAQIFNEFYHIERVIGSENQDFKLSLVSASSQVLKNALSLLSIQTLERM